MNLLRSGRHQDAGGVRRLAALLAVTALLLAGCSMTAADPKDGAEAVVAEFVSAVNEGDFTAAGSYTTVPTAAATDLQFATNRLDGAAVSYRAAKTTASVAEGAVTFVVTWAFDEHTWSYESTADLVTDNEDDWKIVWAPTVVHPDLTGGATLLKSPLSTESPAVVDRHGQPMLTEQLVTVVRLDPAAITDPAGTAAALAGVLNPVVPSVTAESIQQRLATESAAFTLVALRPEIAAQVTIPELPGVTSNQQARLLTTDGTPKPTALGGIDEIYQEVADAATGWRVTLRDQANGVLKEYLVVQPDTAATNLVTTLDATLQAAAQAAVDQLPQQAMIVAIQPSTGGILAVAQNSAASAEGPVALTGQYPPGSTFKIITFGAALAAGTAQPSTVVACPGSATIGGRTIPNDSGFDLGSVPLSTAFAQSCNTTAAALAIELPKDALQSTAAGFGLGPDYTIDGLTTITGSVPASTNDAEQVEASIGQGKVVASPFGMALATATAAAGQRPVPILLPDRATEVDADPAPPSADVTGALRSMMAQTVTSGTAAALGDIDGLLGKTGTAQFGDGSHSHGWFVGIFQDMALAVLVVDGGSSAPAVTVAGDFLRPVEAAVPRS